MSPFRTGVGDAAEFAPKCPGLPGDLAEFQPRPQSRRAAAVAIDALRLTVCVAPARNRFKRSAGNPPPGKNSPHARERGCPALFYGRGQAEAAGIYPNTHPCSPSNDEVRNVRVVIVGKGPQSLRGLIARSPSGLWIQISFLAAYSLLPPNLATGT